MSTRKSTTKQKGGEVPAALRRRAEAIINNAKRYDAGTRKAIRRALREQHADLADCVMRAQQGEMVNDLTAEDVQRNADRAEMHEFAGHLAAVLRIARKNPLIPSGLYNDLADGWNNYINDLPSLAEFQESATYIMLALEARERQRAAKGGAQ